MKNKVYFSNNHKCTYDLNSVSSWMFEMHDIFEGYLMRDYYPKQSSGPYYNFLPDL